MKKTTKPAKKAKPAKVMAKSTKKPEPKVKLSVTKSASKKSEKIEVIAVEAISIEATEEEEEEMESAAARSSGANEAGLAMAAATTEASAGSLKNFRHHPDIENFYRFIYENDLRYEGLEIIDLMTAQRETIKANRAAKSKSH